MGRVLGGGPQDQIHRGAPVCQFFCYRDAHFPGGMVADKPYWIDGLVGRTGRYQGFLPLKVPMVPDSGAGKDVRDEGQDRLRFSHSSVPMEAAGQFSLLYGDDSVAKGLQAQEVGLRGGMMPHILIHCRRYSYG